LEECYDLCRKSKLQDNRLTEQLLLLAFRPSTSVIVNA